MALARNNCRGLWTVEGFPATPESLLESSLRSGDGLPDPPQAMRDGPLRAMFLRVYFVQLRIATRHLDPGTGDLRLHEQGDDLVLLDFGRGRNLDFELLGDVEQLALRFLTELSRGEHRRHFNLRELVVMRRRMLPKVVAAPRTPAASACALLAHIVIKALFGVGAMFGLQKSISLLEPHTSSSQVEDEARLPARSDR